MNNLNTMMNKSNAVGLAVLIAGVLLSACSKQAEPTMAASSSSSSAGATPPVDLNGVWQAENQDQLNTLDGSAIPFTPMAAKLYAQHQAAANKKDYSWDSDRRCLPSGLPRIMAISEPFDLTQDGNLVTMTFQHQRLLRFIYLNQMYPHNSDLSYLGESHGQWDGKVLVVTTGKFKEGSLLDGRGIPHGSKLQVSERYELTAPDTLMDHVTITDEDYFTQPWQTDIVLKKQTGVQVQEDVCVERQGIHK
jgi:hypothetical protein